jgi:chemotaxis protein CheD
MIRNVPELKALVDGGTPVVHLKIGECVITSEPVLISTVLGSCVAITFHHKKTHTSAMFHAMLPSKNGNKSTQGICAFADKAVESILTRYQKLDIRLSQLEVKIFGGANTMHSKEKAKLDAILDVGKKNADMAMAELAKFGLKPSARDILGNRGRKVLFYVATGQIWVKFVDARSQDGPISRY